MLQGCLYGLQVAVKRLKPNAPKWAHKQVLV